jgi:hypothetical protein
VQLGSGIVGGYALQQELGAQPAHGDRILRYDSDRWLQEVGQVEIVEAEKRR